MLLLTTPSTIWLGLKIWSKKFSHFETFWIRSIANDNFSNRPISRYIAQVYFYKTLHHKMWLQLLRLICIMVNLPLQKQKSITSDVAKPRAGGASYDWGRSSNTDWQVHVIICRRSLKIIQCSGETIDFRDHYLSLFQSQGGHWRGGWQWGRPGFFGLENFNKNMIETFRLPSKAKTIESPNFQKDKCDFRWQLETMRRLKCYRGT